MERLLHPESVLLVGVSSHRDSVGGRFLTALAGITDPEEKRKIIGREFIRSFEAAQRRVIEAVGAEGGEIEYSGRIKSLDPATRTGVVIVVAKSGGRKIFGLATLNIRFS